MPRAIQPICDTQWPRDASRDYWSRTKELLVRSDIARQGMNRGGVRMVTGSADSAPQGRSVHGTHARGADGVARACSRDPPVAAIRDRRTERESPHLDVDSPTGVSSQFIQTSLSSDVNDDGYFTTRCELQRGRPDSDHVSLTHSTSHRAFTTSTWRATTRSARASIALRSSSRRS